MDSESNIGNKISRGNSRRYSQSMLRGYRHGFFAVLAFLILANAPPKGHDATGEQEQTNREIADALQGINASLQQSAKPDVAEQPCKRGEDHRTSYLCAQWKAADEAAGSTTAGWVFGGVGSIIGVITMIAAIKAAIYAKSAADETRRSANAAEKAIAETRRIGEAQTRCYVSAIQCKLVYYSNGSCFIGVLLKNSGQSPAINVKISANITHYQGNDDKGRQAKIVKEHSSLKYDIGAGIEQETIFSKFENFGWNDSDSQNHKKRR